MQQPRPDPGDDESDTAFGGLAPRSGPGGETHRWRRSGWLLAAAVIAVIVLVALLVGGRV